MTSLQKLSTKLFVTALTKAAWVSHVNAGSCNGCDIEIVAALSPRYDLERFGILLQGSPRHADVLLCTGSVTRAMAPRLREIYDQMANDAGGGLEGVSSEDLDTPFVTIAQGGRRFP